MKIKNIIFDMDGTILNTLDDICDSVNYMMQSCGYEPLPFYKVKEYVGNGVKTLISRCLPKSCTQDEFLKCFSVFSQHYDLNKNNKTAPYVGILEALKELKILGYSMAVVSNKYHNAVCELTDLLFGDYISVAIGECEKTLPKPNPSGVWLAIELLNGKREESVYIGDSEVDAQTAKNSGLPFIGVTWGFRDLAVLENEGADRIVNYPCEIIKAIESL